MRTVNNFLRIIRYCNHTVTLFCYFFRFLESLPETLSFESISSYSDLFQCVSTSEEKNYLYFASVPIHFTSHPLFIDSAKGCKIYNNLRSKGSTMIEGPKGSGKTTLLLTTYCLLTQKNVTCVYLSCNALREEERCKTYLKSFCGSQNFTTLREYLSYITQHRRDVIYFVDLSSVSASSPSSMSDILSVISTSPCIVALSSGASRLNSEDKYNNSRFGALSCSCPRVVVGSFTETTASEFVTHMNMVNTDVKFSYDDQMKSVCGTNPYLLKIYCTKSEQSVGKSYVIEAVEEFLTDNLHIDSQGGNLAQHLKKAAIFDCLEMINMSLQELKFNEQDKKNFDDSWIRKEFLAVMEKVEGSPSDDTTTSNSNTPTTSNSNTPTTSNSNTPKTWWTLKWNFPTLPHLLLEIINNFCKRGGGTSEIKQLCREQPSLNGIYFEQCFFEYHKSIPLQCSCVEAICDNVGDAQSIKFDDYKAVLSQGRTDHEMQANILYQLRVCHEIIDGVAFLKAVHGRKKWLLFVQTSTQPYNKHRSKMHEVLPRRYETKSKQITTDKSLHNKYKTKLVGGNTQEFNTLLLYVSPEELTNNSEMLPNLRQEIKNFKLKDVYVGELSKNSGFYSYYKEKGFFFA